jgi:hypothetical protein
MSDCPQTFVVCPLCKAIHNGACNRAYFKHLEVRNRFFRGRGLRHWIQQGAIHNPSEPQGRVTTPGVCDADAPAHGCACMTANPVTAATNLQSPTTPSVPVTAGTKVTEGDSI